MAQEEETRLQDQHEMLKLIYHDWDNALHPNFIKDPVAILDCGFGSGNWAYDVAEYDSNCTASRPHTALRQTILKIGLGYGS